MAQSLSILIIDTDRYFTDGLRLGLQAFFRARQQDIHLLEEQQADGKVDIVFLGNLAANSPWLYRLHQRDCHPTVFFIKEHSRNKSVFKSGVQCEKCNSRALHRHQSLFVLYDMLDSVLFSPSLPSLAANHDCLCLSPLTSREEEVLRCIHKGMNGRDTGAFLHISNKTANAHKQNAMRKLNFRCNQELYQWLLQGGGNYLYERSLQLSTQKPTLQPEISLLPPTQFVDPRRSRRYVALSSHIQPEPVHQPEHIST